MRRFISEVWCLGMRVIIYAIWSFEFGVYLHVAQWPPQADLRLVAIASEVICFPLCNENCSKVSAQAPNVSNRSLHALYGPNPHDVTVCLQSKTTPVTLKAVHKLVVCGSSVESAVALPELTDCDPKWNCLRDKPLVATICHSEDMPQQPRAEISISTHSADKAFKIQKKPMWTYNILKCGRKDTLFH
jgi:hypothetical protein